MSFHEFFEFFLTLLHLVKGKLARELIYPQHFLTEETTIVLLESLRKQSVEMHKPIFIPLNEPFIVPTFEQLRLQVAAFSCPILFSHLRPHALYEMLSYVLLERYVVFISENFNLLTAAVYLLS